MVSSWKYMWKEMMTVPDKNYIMFRCYTCGCVFIIPKEYIEHNDNYLTCPKYGKHKDIQVIGAYDSLEECMGHIKYRRNSRGRIEQDG